MTTNPFRWQHHTPSHFVGRDGVVGTLEGHLRRGVAVKLVGGKGMGKSVLLHQVQARFTKEPETGVVLVPGPPDEGTPASGVADIAERLGLGVLPRASMDAVMEAASERGIERIILLVDEADQYVLFDGTGGFARAWFNRLEAVRKAWPGRVGIVVAGGLGLLHVAHVLGSGLLSRAETLVSMPFGLEDFQQLAAPFEADARPLTDEALETLALLSGGNPALATFGLERVWETRDDAVRVLRTEFGTFPAHYPDFMRAVRDGVSHRGLVKAPGRVLAIVRRSAGEVPQEELRAACQDDDPPVDVAQAVQLLEAAGLVRVTGHVHADPLRIHSIASILNLPEQSSAGGDPIERLVADVALVLGQLHRFGRDFHGRSGLLEEQVFSSLLAVGLALLGWGQVDREPVQAAGYPDVRLRLAQPGLPGHALVELKIWPRNDYRDIQAQLDAYRVSDTIVAIAVTLGDRSKEGWAEKYERECLGGRKHERLSTPSDLVGRWRVQGGDPADPSHATEHLLVQIPKRA